jgi:VIT1/CCC1 family predicted Fe2+/Mn2+ transporter
LETLEREEQELINDISNHENQLQTALNDGKRKELQSALKIARGELEITGYKIKLEKAEADGREDRVDKLLETIKTRGDNLDKLLAERLLLLQQLEERHLQQAQQPTGH